MDDDKIKYFPSKKSDDSRSIDEILSQLEAPDQESIPQENQIEGFLRNIFEEAISKNSKVIHIEKFENKFIYRFEIDRQLTTEYEIKPNFYNSIIKRIKILACVAIAEHRFPQAGKITIPIGCEKQKITFHAYIIPTIYGENITLKLAEKQSQLKYQMSSLLINYVQDKLKHNTGLVIIISNEFETFNSVYYSLVKILSKSKFRVANIDKNNPRDFMKSVQDIIHIAVNTRINFDYFRAFLSARCINPHYIMLNNIDILEFSKIIDVFKYEDMKLVVSLKSAGFSDFINKLKEQNINIEKLLPLRTLLLFVSDFRMNCHNCSVQSELSDDDRKWFQHRRITCDEIKFLKGTGCNACHGTGILGRKFQENAVTIDKNFIDSLENSIENNSIFNNVYSVPEDQSILSEIINGTINCEDFIFFKNKG